MSPSRSMRASICAIGGCSILAKRARSRCVLARPSRSATSTGKWPTPKPSGLSRASLRRANPRAARLIRCPGVESTSRSIAPYPLQPKPSRYIRAYVNGVWPLTQHPHCRRRDPMDDDVKFLERLYDRFNARDIDGVLTALTDDVAWANAMDGGHVHGREAVRAYWTRQWTRVDPHVDPLGFHRTQDGAIVG